jgi:hypothetical protein
MIGRSSVPALLLVLLPAVAAAQSPQQWRLSPDLRIGSLDDPDQSLTTITGVSVGPDGRIYIAQAQDNNIRVHDARGAFIRTIGRRGGGPGEFEGMGPPLWRGDTLYISDFRQRRVTMFSPDGELLKTLSVVVNTQPPFLPGGVTRMLDDGSMLATLSVASAAVADGTVTAMPTVRVDRDAAVLDTALWLPVGQSQFSIQLGDGQLYSSQPFPDGPISATDDRGIVVVERSIATDATEGRFRLRWVAFSGDTVLSRAYRYAPKPLERARADSVVAARVESYSDFAQRAGSSRNDLESAIRDAMVVPRFLPPITAVLLSRSGEVWLRREELPGDSVQWNVLGPRGDVLAVFPLPKSVRPRLIDGDVLYTAETDELDVPYLVRYRVVR